MSKHLSALLCIDLQRGFVRGSTPIFRVDELLDIVSSLQAHARACRVPVVHIRFDGSGDHPTAVGTPGWEFDPAVAPLHGDLVVSKRSCDSFHQTSLKQQLEAMGVERLYITGCITELCIDSTARSAAGLGYEVIIVSDGHSTPNATKPGCPTPDQRISWFNHVASRLGDASYRLEVRSSVNAIADFCALRQSGQEHHFNKTAEAEF